MKRTAPHFYHPRYAPRSIGHEILDTCALNQCAVAVGPQLVPQTATDEVTCDFLINTLHLKNDGAQTATVWVRDRQSPACAVIPTLQLPPGGMISMDVAAGYLAPGGMTWYASVTGVVGYVIGTAVMS